MFKIIINEYTENNKAIREYSFKLFGYSLFNRIDTTTNKEVVNALNKPKRVVIKGFKQ